MQLPPETEDEPEWLQVRRQRKKEEGNFAKGLASGNLIFVVCLVPVVPLNGGTLSGVTILWLYMSTIFALNAVILRPKFAKGSTRRYASNLVGTYAAIFAVGSFAAMIVRLLN